MSHRIKFNQARLTSSATNAPEQPGTGTVSPALAKARDVLAKRQRPRATHFNRSTDDDQTQGNASSDAISLVTGHATSYNDDNSSIFRTSFSAAAPSPSSTAASSSSSSSNRASYSYSHPHPRQQQPTAGASSPLAAHSTSSTASTAGSSSSTSGTGNLSSSGFAEYLVSGYRPYDYFQVAAAPSAASQAAAAATSSPRSEAAAPVQAPTATGRGKKRKRTAAEGGDEDDANELRSDKKKKSKKPKKSTSGEQDQGGAAGPNAAKKDTKKSTGEKKKKKKKRNKHEEANAIIRAAMGQEEEGLAEDNDTSTKSDFEAIQSATRYDKDGASKYSMGMGSFTERGFYQFLMECARKKKAARAQGNFTSSYEPKKGPGEKSVMAYMDGVARATFFAQLPRSLIQTGNFSKFSTLATLTPIVQDDFTALPPTNPLAHSADQARSGKLPPLTTVFTPNPLASSTRAPPSCQPPPPQPLPQSLSNPAFADAHQQEPSTALGALAAGLASPPATFQDFAAGINVNATARILTVRHHHHVHHGPAPVFASAQAHIAQAHAAQQLQQQPEPQQDAVRRQSPLDLTVGGSTMVSTSSPALMSPFSMADTSASLDDLLTAGHHSPPPPSHSDSTSSPASISPFSMVDTSASLDDLLRAGHNSPPPPPPPHSDSTRLTNAITSSTTLGLLPSMSFQSTAAMGLDHSSIIQPPPIPTNLTPSPAMSLSNVLGVSAMLSPTFSTAPSALSSSAASTGAAGDISAAMAGAPAAFSTAPVNELPFTISAADVSVLDIPSLYALGAKHNSPIPVCVPIWKEVPRQKAGNTPKVRTNVRKIARAMAYLFVKKYSTNGVPVRPLSQVLIADVIAPFLEHMPEPDTSKGRLREATKEGLPLGTLIREWAIVEKRLVASGDFVEAGVPAAVELLYGFAMKK